MTDAAKHFQDTMGALPDSVALLRRNAPELFESYAATRGRVYGPPLDRQQIELVFVVLDVVAGHVEGAKAHAKAALEAGLTVEAIMQALEICILIHGHHTWATAGAAVMQHLREPGDQLATADLTKAASK